ncbi:helix-turn-helix transcriptional regulator [Micromonospora sp. NPDC005413]|uniref:helix-turn-helix domain-containing protein n=1 Tax=Micromonospora sp. NPDC005413 TaxID=3154563 RepID=UPI0033B37D4B
MTHTDTSTAEQRFGGQVREARELRGWSQEALARHLRESAGLELHQTAIARLERGERAIRLNEVAALAQVLGLRLDQYAGGKPPLTAEEYEQAQVLLEETRRQEAAAREHLARVRVRADREAQEAEGSVAALRDARVRLEASIRDYEERRDG